MSLSSCQFNIVILLAKVSVFVLASVYQSLQVIMVFKFSMLFCFPVMMFFFYFEVNILQ